jgi:hypothetical protein
VALGCPRPRQDTVQIPQVPAKEVVVAVVVLVVVALPVHWPLVVSSVSPASLVAAAVAAVVVVVLGSCWALQVVVASVLRVGLCFQAECLLAPPRQA